MCRHKHGRKYDPGTRPASQPKSQTPPPPPPSRNPRIPPAPGLYCFDFGPSDNEEIESLLSALASFISIPEPDDTGTLWLKRDLWHLIGHAALGKAFRLEAGAYDYGPTDAAGSDIGVDSAAWAAQLRTIATTIFQPGDGRL